VLSWGLQWPRRAAGTLHQYLRHKAVAVLWLGLQVVLRVRL
jgi:hypothetical protein